MYGHYYRITIHLSPERRCDVSMCLHVQRKGSADRYVSGSKLMYETVAIITFSFKKDAVSKPTNGIRFFIMLLFY